MMGDKEIKVIIVDDQPMSILRLADDLEKEGSFEVIATSSSPSSAANLVSSMKPDVLFLDVEMPGKTGFEVMQDMNDLQVGDVMIVFYSAFDKYMIDALRASAFDFLLKPYQSEEFAVVVSRIKQKMSAKKGMSTSANFNMPAESLAMLDGTGGKRAAIQTLTGILLVNSTEVFCFSFDEEDKLWVLRMVNGNLHKLKRQTTATVLLSIDDSFVQVRQDKIINMDYLLGIENGSMRCLFNPPFDDVNIQVSRRCLKEVKRRLEIL